MHVKNLFDFNAFWSGVGYIFNPLSHRKETAKWRASQKKSSWGVDKKALQNDWAAIGNDFREVLNGYDKR